MAVRCAKCGEELLGAVNRCWKCGTTFAARPEIDGRPPIMLEMPPAEAAALAAVPLTAAPLEAVVLDEVPTNSEAPGPRMPVVAAESAPAPPPATSAPPPQPPMATVLMKPRLVSRTSSPADRVESLRQSNMAMGGTVGAVVLGAFALALSLFRFEAAIIATLGLIMGIWGLQSRRRNWALAAMLLCCLAIGVGSYTGMRQLYVYLQRTRPVEIAEPDPSAIP
jgi:hypothetical protein